MLHFTQQLGSSWYTRSECFALRTWVRNVSLVKHSTRGPHTTQFRSLKVCPGFFASACTLRFHRLFCRLGNGGSGGWSGADAAAAAFAARAARLWFPFLPAFRRGMRSGVGWEALSCSGGGAAGGTDDVAATRHLYSRAPAKVRGSPAERAPPEGVKVCAFLRHSSAVQCR